MKATAQLSTVVLNAKAADMRLEKNPPITESTKMAVLAIALCIGAAVRILPLQSSNFPLMDGGMFYAMVRDLQASHFELPAFTSYNEMKIPFAYPPLALYVSAAIQSLFPWPLEEILRWLPFTFSLLTIGAFYGLARVLLNSEWAVLSATIIFAVMPEPIHWMLMGGGLTRSLGFLLAILSLRSICRMYLSDRRRDLIGAVIFSSGVVLSHPQMSWFVAYSSALMFLFIGRRIRAIFNSLIVGIGVIVVTSPWWILVLSRHGWAPYMASTNHGWSIAGGLGWLLLSGGTGEPFVPVLAFAAILGVFVCLLKREFWLPAWVFATFALDGWVPITTGAVPLALLGGVGAINALWPVLVGCEAVDSTSDANAAGSLRRKKIAGWAMLLLGIYAFLSCLGASTYTLSFLSEEERAAMKWVSENTPASSNFLVVASELWSVDRSSEWFPALARRHSVGTVQGTEWLPGGEFVRRVNQNRQLILCAQEGVSCLERWLQRSPGAATHIYVVKRRAQPYSAKSFESGRPEDCCSFLRESIYANPNYSILYDNPGASIYVRRDSVQAIDMERPGR